MMPSSDDEMTKEQEPAASDRDSARSRNRKPLNLKELLGGDLEKDAVLASDGFWDRFAQPTQEECLLEKEKAERATESSDEEETEGSTFISCLVNSQDNNLLAEDEESEALDRILLYLGVFHLPSHEQLLCMSQSMLVHDLIQCAELSQSTRNHLFELALSTFLGSSSNLLRKCMYHSALAIVKGPRLDIHWPTEFARWFGSLGIRPGLEAITSPICANKIPPGRPSDRFLRIIQGLLSVFRTSLHADIPFDQIDSIIVLLIPLLFDPALNIIQSEIVTTLAECLVARGATGRPERFFEIIAPIKDFLTKPIRRLCTLLRTLDETECLPKSLPALLDCCLELEFEDMPSEAFPQVDMVFLARVQFVLQAYERDSSLARLCKALELIYIRLLGTSMISLPFESVEQLRNVVLSVKDMIPAQPAANNLRAIELLSGMACHLEVFLRPRRKMEFC